MLKEQAGNSGSRVNMSERADGKYPALRQHCESVREVHQTIYTSSVDKFTFAWIDSLWRDLLVVLQDLEQLPETTFVEMMEVIEGLRAAGNELRLAGFLFQVEEINPVHRLVMRNRAVLRSEVILKKMLQVWPLHS